MEIAALIQAADRTPRSTTAAAPPRSLHDLTDDELAERIDTMQADFDALPAGSVERAKMGPVCAAARRIVADRAARRCAKCGSRGHWTACCDR